MVIPVSDVDRAKHFYNSLGWSCDIDHAAGDDLRIVQFTPPGSDTSIMFGKSITTATPGSVQGLHLIVSDIEVARSDLIGRGIKIGELFHDPGGIFHRAGPEGRTGGPNPQRKSWHSFRAANQPQMSC